MPVSFTDVDYNAPVDDAEGSELEHDSDQMGSAEYPFSKTWEADTKASGTSLEMGSDAYQRMVMAAHGLSEDEREDVLLGLDSWEHDVEPADKSEMDDQEQEYREDIAESREEMTEQPALDGSFVDGDRKREQMFDFAKQVELQVARQVLEDTASMSRGTADDKMAQKALDELEGNIDELSVKDIRANVANTLDDMEDIAAEEQQQQDDDYEFGF